MSRDDKKTILKDSFTSAAALGAGAAISTMALYYFMKGLPVERAAIMAAGMFAVQLLVVAPAYYYLDSRRKLPEPTL